MREKSFHTHVAIIGGGLAGLSLAYLLAKDGIPVMVIEKEDYPRHKVCGEFISRESMDFMLRSGMVKTEDDFPLINRFELVFSNGNKHSCDLDPGGIGISRFTLDHKIYQLASKAGVIIIENDKANTISKQGNGDFLINLKSGTQINSKVAVAAAGRQSTSLYKDTKPKADKLSWFGVKYHIELPMDVDLIRIMMFEGGYAGVSAVENGRYCFCYLAKTDHLKKFKGDITQFENVMLRKNPEINKLLNQRTIIEGPFTTSGFHFGYKQMEQDDILFCGDAGGFIPPLTGNGMSLAFRNAVNLHPLLLKYFRGEINWDKLKSDYKRYGESYLKKRITSGEFLQNLALDPGIYIQTILSGSMTLFPFLLKKLSNKATGKPF